MGVPFTVATLAIIIPAIGAIATIAPDCFVATIANRETIIVTGFAIALVVVFVAIVLRYGFPAIRADRKAVFVAIVAINFAVEFLATVAGYGFPAIFAFRE
jgi:hypothetical protein